jgi:hypothetical protein
MSKNGSGSGVFVKRRHHYGDAWVLMSTCKHVSWALRGVSVRFREMDEDASSYTDDSTSSVFVKLHVHHDPK